MKTFNRTGPCPDSKNIPSPARPARAYISFLKPTVGVTKAGPSKVALLTLVPVIILAVFFITLSFSRALALDTTLPEMETGKVVLTWTELKGLLDELENLKKAREKEKEEQKKKEEEKPPTAYSIVEAEYHGSVKGKIARFDSRFRVQVYTDGWVSVPFFPNDVGLEEVKIDPVETSPQAGPAPLGPEAGPGDKSSPVQFVRNEKGYSLLAKGPGKISLQVVFNLPVQNQNLVNTVKFVPPRSVINRIDLTILEKGVRLIDTAPAGLLTQDQDRVFFKTALSERDALLVSWKVEKDQGLVRKKMAVCYSLASIDKSAASVLSKITLKHVESLDSVEFHLPASVEIVNVTSPDIDRWQVEQRESLQVIKVEGRADRHQDIEISFTYLLRLNALPADIELPVIGIHDIEMLEGFLGVEVLGNLEVSAGEIKKGLSIPAKNLPVQIWDDASSPLLYGYEFHLNDFSPGLSIKSYREIQTVVAKVDLVDCVTLRTLAGKSVTRVRYFIRNNDRQFLTLTLPDNSRIWQAFLDGKPVKPAQNDTGRILIPMIKSVSQGDELRSFLIEIGYITDVEKLSLKGDIVNRLPQIDLPINYLRWSLFLPEYYGYTKFEGPLKQVENFSTEEREMPPGVPLIDIPLQGARFLFEKYLIVDEVPYIKGKYGQYLGSDNFLSLNPQKRRGTSYGQDKNNESGQQVVPNLY